MSVEGLQGLNILVISPNEWGTMRVSKHHYAVQLAERGNRVFFLNPPDPSATERISIEEVNDVPGLATITYRPFVPFAIRFRSRAVFNRIAHAHVRWLLGRLGVRFDVVWCFDVNLYSDLRWFDARLKIYQPVDQVVQRYQIAVGATADLVASVSEEILRKFRTLHVPILRVEHGLAAPFVALAGERDMETYAPEKPLRAGYVGNLLMKYIDRATVYGLVSAHPEIEFHFWGPRTPQESNVAAADSPETREFIRALSNSSNAVLHGPHPPSRVAAELCKMDVLFLCYDTVADPNRGCNSHKILEYLSTGRVVVASHTSDYAGRPDLIEMLPTADNTQMLQLFESTIRDIATLNSDDKQRNRRAYAVDNSYAKQIDRIAKSLCDTTAGSAVHAVA